MRGAGVTPVASSTAVELRNCFAIEVAEYLQRSPRQLPSKYFYDALGSSLFEAICRLPWYKVTRAESALLARHASEIVAPFQSCTVAELGCGNGEKLAVLLEQGGDACRDVHLIDISGDALQRARERLRSSSDRAVTLHQGTYEQGLSTLRGLRRRGPLMILFLGSNIGNFDPGPARELLRAIRASLADGDALLLGTDLVKPEADLQLAYADPLRVTAAFNLNLLRRINDELGGTFDLDGFGHRAVWNARASRVEMHLVSRRDQVVHIRAADLSVAFARAESIWTESSYKYDAAAVVDEGLAAGFTRADQWIDDDAKFAVTRFTV